MFATVAFTVSFGVSASALDAPAATAGHASYRLKLGPFVIPPTRTAGLIVKASIDGGPPLRLLLDSGTQSIVLDGKALRNSGYSRVADFDLVGAGASAAEVVKEVVADTVQVGDLTLRRVPLLIAPHRLAYGIQGVLPLSVFGGFLIRLDIPKKNLDLLPYPQDELGSSGALKTLASNHLLFVKGTVNEAHEGYFLLDTGACYSAISQSVARELRISEGLAPRVALQAGTAAIDAALLEGAVRLRIGARDFSIGPVVAVDLAGPSSYHNVRISGLIGYPALSNSVVRVNYRDSFIRIESR